MLLYKIIKAAEVPENLLQVLPLRCYATVEEPEVIESGSQDVDHIATLLSEAEAQAGEIVSQARASADDITRQAQLSAEKIKQEAYQSGFEEGRQSGANTGYQEGIAKAEKEAAAIRAQAAEVLEQAEELRRHTLETLEQEIVELARDIAEKLLSAQLSLKPETVMQVVAESLRLVSDRLNVVLYINPLELELVENRRAVFLDILPAGAQLQVIADPSIEAGGCKVDTEQGWVDATMETRRKELIKALYGSDR